MIRCTNCGTMNPENRINCLNCMAVLPASTARSEQSPSPRTNILQDQPVLPAWLESLRAGDHPAAPPKNFSREDMVEEGKVPSWMQADRPIDKSSQPYPTMRSASSPAPNTDETFMQGKNISANSLIDENSLPSWMQQPEKQQGQPQNISASSLVQPEYVPEWMKTAQAQNQPQPSSTLPPQQSPQIPVQSFSAQQLIDPQSLPSWMQAEGGQNAAPFAQQSAPQLPNNFQEQQGFSASSLLDMNSLPSWMREGQAQNAPAQPQPAPWQTPQQPPMQQGGYGQSWQSPQQAGPSQSWQPQQGGPSQSWQMPSPPQAQGYPPASPIGNNAAPPQQGPAGTLSTGSLIDMNSLPSWLRSAAESQPQGQMSEQQGYMGYGASQRVDNVRVPSRPRGEVGTNEGSEVAANVFASMLGVASNAPQFPQQQPSAFQAQSPMMPPQQSSEAQRNPLNASNYGMQPGQNMYGSPAAMQQPPNSGMSQQQTTQNTSEKTAKKGGLFEAIRNFFFRQ